MDEKFLNKIVELQNLFDEGVLTTADNIPQPEPRQDVVDREAINRFMRDNPMASGGRIGLKEGYRPGAPIDPLDPQRKISEVMDAYDRYYKGPGKKIRKIPFRKFFEIYAKENFADGGRIGFKDGLSAKVIKEKFPTYFDPSYTGNLGDVNTIKKVLNLYTKKKMGSILIQRELAKQGIKASNASIRRLVKLAVDQKLIKRVSDFKTFEDQRIYGKDEKRIIREKIRPVTELDRKTKTRNIPKNAKYKIVYYKPSGKSFIPKEYQGIQYYNSLESAEKALNKKQNLNLIAGKYKSQDDAVKIIHRIALENSMDINDPKELAKLVYGNSKLQNLKNIGNDLVRYQQFLLGFKDIKGLKIPTGEILDDILFDFPAENEYGKFAAGNIRQAKLEIRDKLLNTKGDKLIKLRNKVLKLIDSNALQLDETLGVAATFEQAPGYTELGQVIDKEINKKKGTQIDRYFIKLFKKVMAGETNPTVVYKGKTIDVEQFNKISEAFAKKNKIDTPTIIYKPGEKLDASKFIDSFDRLSLEAQKNIKEIAKKGVVLPTKSEPISFLAKALESTGKDKPITVKDLNNFRNLLNNLAAQLNTKCARKTAADGGRINFEYGSVACQAEAKNYVKESLAKGIDPKATDVKSNIVKKIFRSTLNFAKGVLDPKELLNLRSQFFSAGALASIPIFDGVIAADAAIRKGKPIQEALKDTLTFGFLSTPQNVLDAQKVLDSTTASPAAKDYAQRILTANELERAKKDAQTIGVDNSFFAQKVSDLEQKLKGMEYNRETGLGGEVGKRDFESELANIKDKFTATPKKFDAPDKTDAPSFFSGQLKPTYGDLEQLPGQLPGYATKMVPAYTSNSYDTAKLDLPTEDFIGALSEALGYEKPSSEQAKEMINQERFRQLFETPGFTGTQERFNKGGIAGLSGGDNSGPPPERGPNSEGLSSLLKRGTNI